MATNTFKPNFLKGKIALITGGATGICYEIAHWYLKYGCTVCIMSRKKDVIEKAIVSLKQISGSSLVYGHTCDVRKLSDIETAVDYFVQNVGKIDILINGAAGNFLVPFNSLTANGFKTVMEIDLLGTFQVSKVVVEKCMMGRGGVIINITANLYGVIMQVHAGSAKAGVDNITKTLSVELGPQKIRVNGIAPGTIEGTAGFDKLMPKTTEKVDLTEFIPICRLGTKSDIADAALFLASDAASYISGQTINVDGGQGLALTNFPLGFEMVRRMWKPKL